MVSVGEVVEDSKVDGEDAHGCDADCDCGYYPVYRRERSPPKHEEANWHESALIAGKVKAGLWRIWKLVVFLCEFFLVNADEGEYDGGDADGRKDCARFLDVESVASAEDKWDRGQGEVQDCP